MYFCGCFPFLIISRENRLPLSIMKMRGIIYWTFYLTFFFLFYLFLNNQRPYVLIYLLLSEIHFHSLSVFAHFPVKLQCWKSLTRRVHNSFWVALISVQAVIYTVISVFISWKPANAGMVLSKNTSHLADLDVNFAEHYLMMVTPSQCVLVNIQLTGTLFVCVCWDMISVYGTLQNDPWLSWNDSGGLRTDKALHVFLCACPHTAHTGSLNLCLINTYAQPEFDCKSRSCNNAEG